MGSKESKEAKLSKEFVNVCDKKEKIMKRIVKLQETDGNEAKLEMYEKMYNEKDELADNKWTELRELPAHREFIEKEKKPLRRKNIQMEEDIKKNKENIEMLIKDNKKNMEMIFTLATQQQQSNSRNNPVIHNNVQVGNRNAMQAEWRGTLKCMH